MTCVLKLKYRSNTRENVNDMYLNDQSLTGYKWLFCPLCFQAPILEFYEITYPHNQMHMYTAVFTYYCLGLTILFFKN